MVVFTKRVPKEALAKELLGGPVFPMNFDPSRSLMLVFAENGLSSTPEFSAFLEKNSHVPSLGCSTAGEIFGAEVGDDSMVYAAITFSKTPFRIATADSPDSKRSFGAGQSLGQQLNDPQLKAVLVLSDGLSVNGTALIDGLKSSLSSSVVITGGLAGDGSRFHDTWVLAQGQRRTKCISALGLYGDAIEVLHGCKGGWDIFGVERVITKSVDNVVFQIDGQPALGLYKKYLGDRAKDLPASGLLFPMQIRDPKGDGTFLVRTILAVDENQQSLTFAGDMPEGYFAQLMRANFEHLIDGAKTAARETERAQQSGLCIPISCVGRKLVLGERVDEEVEAVKQMLPKNSHQIGFYSYGELSPHFSSGPCQLQNQTMTLTYISEKDIDAAA